MLRHETRQQAVETREAGNDELVHDVNHKTFLNSCDCCAAVI